MRRPINLVLWYVELVLERLREVGVPRICFVVGWEVKVTLGLLSTFAECLSHGVKEEAIDHMLFLWFLLGHNSILYLFHYIFAFFMTLGLETSQLRAHKLLAPRNTLIFITIKKALILSDCAWRHFKNNIIWKAILRLRNLSPRLFDMSWNRFVIAFWKIKAFLNDIVIDLFGDLFLVLLVKTTLS
jgi:hypothetical protein